MPQVVKTGKFLAFVFLYVTVFFLVYGIYDDTRDIAYRTALLRGDFTGMPISNLYLYFVGVAKPLSLLLNFLPKVSWVGCLLVTMHLFAVGVFGVVLSNLLKKKFCVTFGWRAFILVLVIFSLFSEALFYLSIACSSMMGASAAVVCLFYVVPELANRNSKMVLRVISWFFLSLAVFIQNEVTLVALLSIFLFLHFCGGNLLRTITLWGGIVLVYGAVYLNIYFTGGSEQKNFLTNEAYLFTYYDTYFVKNETGLSPTDSVKVECMKQWFVWDKQEFNPAFFRKITAAKPVNGINATQLKLKLNLYAQGLREGLFNRLPPTLCLNIFCLGVCIGTLFKSSQRLWWFLAYKALLVVFFSAVCIFLKFEYRLLHSVLAVDTLLGLVFVVGNLPICKNMKSVTIKTVQVFFLLLLAGGSIWKHNYYKRINQEQITAVAESKNLRQEIDSLFHHQILVPGLEATLPLVHNYPLQTERATNNNIVLGYDAGYTTYYREFNEWLVKNCGNDNFNSFIRYLWHHRQQVVIIASEEKLTLWRRYLKIVYKKHIDFAKIADSCYKAERQKTTNRKTLAYYRLSAFEEIPTKP